MPIKRASNGANKGVFAIKANISPAIIKKIGIIKAILSKSMSVNDIRINPQKRTRYGKFILAGRTKLRVEIDAFTAYKIALKLCDRKGYRIRTPITVIITGMKNICLSFNFMEYLQNTTNLEIEKSLFIKAFRADTFKFTNKILLKLFISA